jgi:hypothetical protein
MNWLLDANVIVTLCQRGELKALAKGPHPFWVPEQVDDELTAYPDKYPDQQRQYEASLAQGLIVIIDLPPGSAEHHEYLRLRRNRGNSARDQGEDACVAVALVRADSLVCTGDTQGAKRARQELGSSRVRTREELLALLGL